MRGVQAVVNKISSRISFNFYHVSRSVRLDQLLIHKSLARSRTQAQKLITSGLVRVAQASQWQVVTKPSQQFEEDADVEVTQGEEQRYVSRAGLKLEGALKALEISPAGLTCLDVGQSTGGFTDCLLQHGAAMVVGIDVGHTQLDPGLRGKSQVVCIEGVNARELPVEEIFDYTDGRKYPFAVMDVSFISQTLILPGLAHCLTRGAYLVSLVKPQFEVGPQGLAKGGIVKNDALFGEVQEKVESAAREAGFEPMAYIDSVIEGGDGNREFFMFAKKL